ncbi:MAG TPA: GxxExxY protein [Candidatus Thermoplasmatota archaeon]|nr:GxxExxY protein [Candidatus Thermoplasmatota archaeon]
MDVAPYDVDDPDANLNRVTASILEASFRVHSALGPGLLEKAYRIFLVKALRRKGHRVEEERYVDAVFEGDVVERAFRLDLLVDDLVVVELKAISEVNEVHLAQLMTYLRLARKPVGLLLNFNTPRLRKGIYRRVCTEV